MYASAMRKRSIERAGRHLFFFHYSKKLSLAIFGIYCMDARMEMWVVKGLDC